jgi:hypothetical protein
MTGIFLRGALAYLVLTLLAVALVEPFTTLLLPVFRWELAALLPDFTVARLGIERPTGEAILALGVEVARPVNLGGLWLPGMSADSSTLLGHVAQPAILCFALLLALPVRAARDYFPRLLCGAVAVCAALMIDTPLVLAGAIIDVMAANAPAPVSTPPPLAVAMNLLNGGGRALLGVLAAILAVVASSRWRGGVAKSSSSLHDIVTS